MGYEDLQTLLNPASGVAATSAWGDQIRENFECGEYTLVRTILGSAGSSISSGTLPTLSNAYKLGISYRVQHASTTSVDVIMRFNADSGSNYVRQYLLASDTTVSGDAVAATTGFLIGSCGNESANRWATGEFVCHSYLGSSHKQILGHSFDPRALTATLLILVGGNWASTAAITSVSVTTSTGNFVTGSSLDVRAYNFV